MRVWILIGLYFLPILTRAQEAVSGESRFTYYLNQYIETGTNETITPSEISNFIVKLRVIRAKTDDSNFLKTLFSRTHNKFLKQYRNQASFNDIFKNGRYNCLTGTALLALLLDRFEFDYQIIETNYHIFILVHTEGNNILLEATDPHSGFVSDQKMVRERINLYRENKIQELSPDHYHYHFSFDLYNGVALKELTGLMYYNQAVEAFNRNQLDRSVQLLDKATESYKSERIEEFSRVILLALVQSNLEAKAKITYLKKVQSLRQLTL